MKIQDFTQATFVQIIEADYNYGSVLDTFGLDFISNPNQKLKCACREKNLDLNFLIQKLHQSPKRPVCLIGLSYRNCKQIIAHLKETHRYFMRLRLPYMLRVIEKMDEHLFEDKELAGDLKWIFPEFVIDFSAHILEEEETIFAYILELEKAAAKPRSTWKIFATLQQASMQRIIENHLEEDDEMLGIRTMTNGYLSDEASNPYKKLIYNELKSFESELKQHARVENELLFPSALELESELHNYLLKIQNLC